MVLLGIPALLTSSSFPANRFRRALPWLWILALAQIICLFTLGLRVDVGLAMAKDLLPVPTFLSAKAPSADLASTVTTSDSNAFTTPPDKAAVVVAS